MTLRPPVAALPPSSVSPGIAGIQRFLGLRPRRSTKSEPALRASSLTVRLAALAYPPDLTPECSLRSRVRSGAPNAYGVSYSSTPIGVV